MRAQNCAGKVSEECSYVFEVLYIYKGVVRKYRPDFIIQLASGNTLVLEVKAKDTEQDQAKIQLWGNYFNSYFHSKPDVAGLCCP